MRTFLFLLTIAYAAGFAMPAGSQTVKMTAGRIVPFEGVGVTPREAAATQAKGAGSITMYATAFLGEPGEVDGGLGGRVAFHYATLHLLFSAAALPQAKGGVEPIPSDNLQHVNGHVSIVPLDSAMRPIDDQSAVLVLGTFPDSILLAAAQTPDSGSTQISRAAFGAAVKTYVPALEAGELATKRLGKMLVSFKDLFHRPSARVQVAYVSELREFGWMWHQHQEARIEGTHRTSAALEVAPNVRYLSVKLRVIASWRSHGAWQRDMDLVLELPKPMPPIGDTP
jgi:hypothetical protein